MARFAEDESKPALAGGFEGRKQPKMRPPMRSSIACLRCRKSKIKCENNGGSSACDTCIKTGKECIFKLPEANPTPPKRNDPPSGVKQERDGGSERKKLKKLDDISKLDTQKVTLYADDVLSAPFLTEDVWDQVLDLYKLHFAPELPFLHLPTMRERLRRRFKSPQAETSADFNLVLLGVLTLTARFHSDLVKYLAHVCNSQSGNARSRPLQTQLDPATASEYYATTLTKALGPLGTGASVERVQALLMLGLYEWGQTHRHSGGQSAWMYVGMAIRMAQFLRLGFGDKSKDASEPSRRSVDYRSRATASQSQLILEREVKRRTMFSCFILDQMLACGKERLYTIRPMDLQIQLPCSEDKFDLQMEARTGFLYPRMGNEREITDDSVLSQFIRLVDLWGDISKWSSAGGRLIEEFPPWDDRTTFRRLREEMEAFDASLPDTFTFSRSNYFKHENHQASSVYILLHMLRNVCLIMLHREYIPFVPIHCKGPEGPVDRPTFPKDEAPTGFWVASAEYVFKASREILELIEICQKKDKLPQSTIVLFGIWNAAFVGLYAVHFPQMDTHRHLLDYQWNEEVEGDVFQQGSTGLTYQTLNKMSIWLKMSATYARVLHEMNDYFHKIKEDFERHAEKNKALSEKTNLSLRLGGRGGGLEDYKKFSLLKDFGSLHPEQEPPMDTSDRSRASTMERASSVGAESRNASAIERVRTPRSTPSASFTAINHTPIAAPLPDSASVSEHRMDGGLPSTQHEGQGDPWSRYQPPAVRQQHSPTQAYPSGMLDFSTSASLMRFGDINDLGIFTQNNEPWSDVNNPYFFGALQTDATFQMATTEQPYGSYWKTGDETELHGH